MIPLLFYKTLTACTKVTCEALKLRRKEGMFPPLFSCDLDVPVILKTILTFHVVKCPLVG